MLVVVPRIKGNSSMIVRFNYCSSATSSRTRNSNYYCSQWWMVTTPTTTKASMTTTATTATAVMAMVPRPTAQLLSLQPPQKCGFNRYNHCYRYNNKNHTAATSAVTSNVRRIRFSSSSGSDSITYSGGQASVGQGGFYGSGGARALSPDHKSDNTNDNNDNTVSDQQSKNRNKMLAMAHDVQSVRLTMHELDLLESLLRNEEESNKNSNSTNNTKINVSFKSMEIKNSIKKLMTTTEFLESLNNLEVQGEPAWGLSCEEREMIVLAREKVNGC